MYQITYAPKKSKCAIGFASPRTKGPSTDTSNQNKILVRTTSFSVMKTKLVNVLGCRIMAGKHDTVARQPENAKKTRFQVNIILKTGSDWQNTQR